ncbi:MAG: hypothetical protein IJG50_03605 [Clostridia bacterium]|nr:hypothetical protein [Clostridia bacterium]
MKRKYRKRWAWVPFALSMALFVVVALWAMSGVQQAAEASERDGLRQAELAVRRAAVSCYAVEGAYPATYDALKSASGIAVDEEKYIVYYEIFASNIMPEITVVRRPS